VAPQTVASRRSQFGDTQSLFARVRPRIERGHRLATRAFVASEVRTDHGTEAPERSSRAPATQPFLDLAGRTDIGRVRQRNEDQFVIAHLGRWLHVVASSAFDTRREMTTLQGTLLVVADGMGGQGAGDVASAVALDSFLQHSLLEMPWLAAGTPDGDALLRSDVSTFVVDCQARLSEVAQRDNLPRRLGTTLTAAYLQGSRLIVAHVGDSRAYLLRKGALMRLTRDHTLSEALGSSNEAFTHVLVNAIGGSTEPPRAELSARDLQSGDRVLLCTDGLYGPVDDARIAELLGSAATAEAAASALVDEALARGGPDNVTVAVAVG
jgi:serine/threonine protein phosphatase PrpC